MPAEDIIEDIEDAATKPKSASTDTGTVTQHSLADQIAAAKFLAEQEAKADPRTSIFRIPITHPGTA
jgi:hypothetical protein